MVCGSLSQCAHDEESPAIDSDTGRKLTNLSKTHSDLDTCDMVTNRPIEPGRQIFNTYGESLTNAQLLARYGFALDGNENDIISWELSELEAPQGMDSRSFVSLVDQVIRIWPRFTGWQESNLVYQPTTAFLPGSLEGGIGRHQPALCVNGDARISHQLWIYCAIYAMAQEMYFLRNVDEVLEFLDRVAIGQIYRERRAGGNEEEGSDAVHSSAEGPRLSTASRVMTDSSEDDEIEQVRVFPS